MKNNHKNKWLLAGLCFAMLQSASAQTKFSWNNLPKAALPTFKTDTVSIVQYGAVADGLTLNTKAINAAITACNTNGGGVVLIPQGLWLTGPIVLKSNVNLHIDRAAMVQFTDDKSQYALVAANFEGHAAPRNESPISGTDLINIAITGGGIFDGGGDAWRAVNKDSLTEQRWKVLLSSGGVLSADGREWFPSESYVKGSRNKEAAILQPGKPLRDYAEFKDYYRPNLLVLTNCKKVLLTGTTFQSSPAWCMHTLLCEDLTLNDVHVRNPFYAQNGDAIDVESCRNVLIENSTFDAGDDGLCIKSGRDEEGRRRGKPTENVVIRNNIVYRAHGGFVIGSEMSGGARNIFVTDCTFIGTDIGLRFKTVRGRGGIVEDIYIKNIAMRNILNEAILFDMYYMSRAGSTLGLKEFLPVTEGTPQFRNFYVSNVVCSGARKAMLVRGLPEMSIKGVHLENMMIRAQTGVELIEASDISLKNITLQITDKKQLINIENSSDITLDNIKSIDPTNLFVNINGARSRSIRLINTHVTANKKVEFNNGAEKRVFIDD